MNTEFDWRELTLTEFVQRYSPTPRSKSLRAVLDDPKNNTQQRRMVHFRSESEVHGVRRVGPQTGAEIIGLMKQLGWQPRPS